MQKRIPHIPARPWAFIRYTWRHLDNRTRWQMLAGMLLTVGVIGSELAVVWAVGRLINAMVHPVQSIWIAVGLYVSLIFIFDIMRSTMVRSQEYLDRRVLVTLPNLVRNLLFNRLLQQSQSFLHNNFAGVLANHVRRAGEVMTSLYSRIQYQIVALAARFIGTGLLLWAITPWLSALLLVFIIAAFIVSLKMAPIWSKLSEATAAASSANTGFIVDSTTNLAAVQQNAGWQTEQRQMQKVQDNFSKVYLRRSAFLSWFWGGFDIISAVFFVGFIALIAYGWQHGDLDAGQLAMATALVGQLFQSLAQMVSLLTMKMDDIGTLRDALHKISTPLAVLDNPQAPDLQISQGLIEFHHVSFSYPNGQVVFDNLSLALQPGQRVGFIGVSGAGKTTLCQLLMRAYDVTSGSITIDGQNIASVTQDSLHQAIAVIPQEPLLFHRSLADNIAYGRPDYQAEYDAAAIKSAAESAQAAGFIESLPDNYATLVGERGVKLSGGQRQRVAIARAIYKNAPILILDEATSALDSETERDIQTAMRLAMEGRTTIVVAHRLSTIAQLDRIIVMEQGRIAEDGTFAELQARQGIFARLWDLQAGGFIAEHF